MTVPSHALQPGERLGVYEIESFLGSGGHSEVYRARDTRLNRPVAIKILRPDRPGAVSAERLQQEARTLSKLSHPFISALHDVGRWRDFDYLVTEFLDGEPLNIRIAKRPLTPHAALVVGTQIARALDAAHRHGIVHRDVKPSNIILTTGGATLVDFGIAADMSQERQASTAVTTATEDALSPRTVAYGSPEQLEGLPLDSRSDIFSLGIVLYELLARRHPFHAESAAGYIAAILEHDPPSIDAPGGGVTPAAQRAVMKALEKDPAGRWQSAGDLASELEWVTYLERRDQVAGGVRRGRLAALVGTGVLALALVGAAVWRLQSGGSPPPVFSFQLEPGQGSFITTSAFAFSLSPDGSALSYTKSSGGPRLLSVRKLSTVTATDMPGTDEAWAPFWSPDSTSIGFFAAGKLKRLDLTTGGVQVIADVPRQSLGIGAWGATGTILVFANQALYRVPATGGTLERVRLDGDADTTFANPEFLPDSEQFLVLAIRAGEPAQLHAARLGSTAHTPLLDVDTQARYTQGHLLFMRGDRLLAQPFDADTLRVGAATRVVVSGVSGSPGVNRGAFSVSHTGVLAYRPAQDSKELVWVDRTGRVLQTLATAGSYANPAVAPDGRQVAVSRLDPSVGTRDIYILDPERGARRLTRGAADDDYPAWSPDGRRVIYSSNRTGAMDIFSTDAGLVAAEDTTPLLRSAAAKWVSDVTRDGRFVIYQGEPGQRTPLWALSLNDRRPIPLVSAPADGQVLYDAQGQVSPDGRWLAYVSDAPGSPQVYVQAFPAASERWQVSVGGGFEPKWRGDGKELYYLALDQSMMVAEVRAEGASFAVDVPRPLFRTPVLGAAFQNGTLRNEYAVSPDGTRFLINRSTGTTSPNGLSVVSSWQAVSQPSN